MDVNKFKKKLEELLKDEEKIVVGLTFTSNIVSVYYIVPDSIVKNREQKFVIDFPSIKYIEELVLKYFSPLKGENFVTTYFFNRKIGVYRDSQIRISKIALSNIKILEIYFSECITPAFSILFSVSDLPFLKKVFNTNKEALLLLELFE